MSDTGRVPLTQEAATETAQSDAKAITNPSRGSEVNIEVPYLDADNFLTDYFKIGTEWKDFDATFADEIDNIDSYIKSKIESKEIPNSQKAARDILKGIEKVNNLNKEKRSVVRLEVLSNYVEFLMKNDDLKSNLRRYNG
jgi:DNA polymerase II small subunit/DNA polymerase delta subunit B